MRVLKWSVISLLAVFLAIGLGLAGCNVLDRGPSVDDANADAGGFDLSRLLVLVDADMAATAYANGQLYPIEGTSDVIVVLDDPGASAPARREAAASNTVMGWPGAMTADPHGRFAYVVEGRAPPPPGVAQMDSVYTDMPDGTLLTTIDLASGELIGTRPVCRRPSSIDIAPNGRWLLIPCGDDSGELTIVPLEGGLPGTPRVFDLDLPAISARPGIDDGLSYGMVHPNGTEAAYILSNLGVGLVRFEMGEGGTPVSAEAEAPIQEGDWLTMGRWTRSGDHFLVADVAWGPSGLDAVLNGNGAIHSFALSPDNDVRGVVSTATVSKSPEAFEMNRTGDRLAVVNMERTYLPGGALSVVPRRGASSLSLVAVDEATGTLSTLGDPVGFRGILPEDAVFDTDGDRLAVVVYQDHDAPRSDGWVEIFAVEGDRIVPTGRRIPMPRGAHDLFALD